MKLRIKSGSLLHIYDTKTWKCIEKSNANSKLKFNLLQQFLPSGGQQAVHEGYLSYTKWHFGSATASSISGVLSMQSLLYAVGLGAGSIPMAGALNWIIKDGLGQLGGVLYASRINDRFDADPKKWRSVSAVALDSATLLEILTPLFPNYFVFLASLANIGKNVSWLSASATRAGIHQSFARRDNLGDITAKAGSQGIAASLTGTAIGVAISPCIGASTSTVLSAFMVLSAVHLGCLYKSLTFVNVPTLNAQRLQIVLDRFMVHNRIPSPREVSKEEQFLRKVHFHTRLCTSMDEFCQDATLWHEIDQILSQENYRIIKEHPQSVKIILHENASNHDILRAHVHSKLLLSQNSSSFPTDLENSYHQLPPISTTFLQTLSSSKWHLQNLFLQKNPARFSIAQ